MAQVKPRLDPYGQPLPELRDAREESFLHRPANVAALDTLQAMLREVWRTHLQRGWYGSLVLEISIDDDIIRQDIVVTERRSRRVRE